MFEYVKGNLIEITPSNAIVEAYGFGYNHIVTGKQIGRAHV